MGLSIRTYARHRGVSHVTMKKVIDTRRITPLPDGMIDPDTADARWAQNTLQPRKAAVLEKISPSKVRVLPEREVPEPGVPPLSMGGTSLLQARIVNEVPKAQLNKVELVHRKKEPVDRARAVAHVFKLACIECDAQLNQSACISGQTAPTLGIDARQTHVALEAAVRERLIELGKLHLRVDW